VSEDSTDPATLAQRVVGTVAVGAAAVTWWPAFTLGAWRAVFFEQLLLLWAVATAALVVVVLRGRPKGVSAPLAASLLIPSVWLVSAFLPIPDGSTLSAFTNWAGIAITLLGFPFMVWVLLQIAKPSTVTVDPRYRAAAIIAVLLVALLSYLLGTQHPRFLTCADFAISGNSEPPGCTVGEGTLSRP